MPRPSDLAADIGNYLRNLPVNARAPNIGYRAIKYVRRHRLGVGIATAGIVLLDLFGCCPDHSSQEHSWQRDRADRITAFMTNIFRVSDPSESRGDTVTAREILDKSSAKSRLASAWMGPFNLS